VWGDEERAAIDRILRRGQLTMGAEVATFEREFASYHDRKYAIMVNSGSSANLVAVAALCHRTGSRPIKRGDVALVPALAWSTTYAPIIQHGLDLALMDCDGGWNADVYHPRLDAKNARLVVGCSILGNPANLEAMRTMAGVLDAAFLEDNCESIGARTSDGKLCGTFGDLSTFSFFYSHQVSAIEGGAILTDDEELAGLCRILRAHGWTRDVTPPVSFDEEYNFVAFGYNVRPLEMHAAVARCQLRKLDAFTIRRRMNAVLFRKLTADLPIFHPDIDGDPSPFGLHFMVNDHDARNRLAVALRGDGIDCRLPTGGSLTRHPYGARWSAQETPRADAVHDQGMFLGNGPLDLTDQITAAVEVMRRTL
jgi:CDP-6-deoxy-D-xylo-4-hexulose-3-dehydrase